ncbi:MAG: hypothetical protein ACPGWR_22690 [Ardenticatenaceae bacterium]
MTYLSSAVGHLSSAVGYLSSEVGHLSSAVGYLSSEVGHWWVICAALYEGNRKGLPLHFMVR